MLSSADEECRTPQLLRPHATELLLLGARWAETSQRGFARPAVSCCTSISKREKSGELKIGHGSSAKYTSVSARRTR